MSKPQVIAKMRTIYVNNGKTEANMGARIAMLGAILRSFNEDAYNTFAPDMSTFPDPFDYT